MFLEVIILSNEIRTVFIGSSREGGEYAKKLKILLDEKLCKYNLQCVVWDEPGTFTLSDTTISNLEKLGKELRKNFGYAILLLTPDDKIEHRGKEYFVPRDNVVFELGLFTGILGRQRTFCVSPANVSIKMFSDWRGVTNAVYTYEKEIKDDDWIPLLESATKSLEKTIEKIERPIVRDDTINVEKVYKNTSEPTRGLANTIAEIERNRNKNKNKNIGIGGF